MKDKTSYLPVFVVSLPGETLRKRHIRQQLAGYGGEWSFVDAVIPGTTPGVDWSSATDPQRSVAALGRPLVIGEYGCALSHLMVMRKISEEKICAAVILEDDAIIFGDFGRVCNAALKEVKFDVLLLGYSKVNAYDLGKRHLTEPMQAVASCFGRQLGFSYRERRTGTVGYVVTEAGAKKILAIQGDVITVADDWPYFKLKNLDIAHIYPAVVLEDTFSTVSAIAADRREMEGNHVATLVTFRAIVRLARGVIWSIILSLRRKKLMAKYSLRRKE